jgi:hypothetical protein
MKPTLTSPSGVQLARTTAPDPDLLGRAVYQYCRSAASLRLLDSVLPGMGWQEGGCWILADALANAFGGEIWAMVSRPSPRQFLQRPNGIEEWRASLPSPGHMLLKFRGLFIDSDGTAAAAIKLRDYAGWTGIPDAILLPLDVHTVKLIPRPTKGQEIAAGVRPRLRRLEATSERTEVREQRLRMDGFLKHLEVVSPRAGLDHQVHSDGLAAEQHDAAVQAELADEGGGFDAVETWHGHVGRQRAVVD